MTKPERNPRSECPEPNAEESVNENEVRRWHFRISAFGFLSGFGIRISDLVPIALALALTLASGCAGYRLGPTNGLSALEKSVQIAPFGNQTLEPRLGDAVTFQIRKQLHRDGTYRLATRDDDGDILVTGVVTRYGRQGVSFVPSDVVTVRDYRLSMTAQVTARERGTGRIILNQPVSGSTLIRVQNDLTSSERQALPLLAGDLARNLASLLADGSW